MTCCTCVNDPTLVRRTYITVDERLVQTSLRGVDDMRIR